MGNSNEITLVVPPYLINKRSVSQPVNFTNFNYVKLLICITVMMRFEIPHPLC